MESFQNITSYVYPNDTKLQEIDIIFTIHSPEDSNVKLNFFDMLLDGYCYHSSLIIYDGMFYVLDNFQHKIKESKKHSSI